LLETIRGGADTDFAGAFGAAIVTAEDERDPKEATATDAITNAARRYSTAKQRRMAKVSSLWKILCPVQRCTREGVEKAPVFASPGYERNRHGEFAHNTSPEPSPEKLGLHSRNLIRQATYAESSDSKTLEGALLAARAKLSMSPV